jgi:hypothetical protein
VLSSLCTAIFMVCVKPIDGHPCTILCFGAWQEEEFVSLRSAYRSGSTPFASSHRSGLPITQFLLVTVVCGTVRFVELAL